MVLIHGPYGSGKSTLLVSIIRFLRQQVPLIDDPTVLQFACHVEPAVFCSIMMCVLLRSCSTSQVAMCSAEHGY